MNPDGAFLHTQRSNNGAAIRVYRQPFRFHRAGRDLLGLSVRKALAPQVTVPVHGSREIHPRSIWRPTGGSARSLGTYWYGFEIAIERDKTARCPASYFIHLDN